MQQTTSGRSTSGKPPSDRELKRGHQGVRYHCRPSDEKGNIGQWIGAGDGRDLMQQGPAQLTTN